MSTDLVLDALECVDADSARRWGGDVAGHDRGDVEAGIEEVSNLLGRFEHRADRPDFFGAGYLASPRAEQAHAHSQAEAPGRDGFGYRATVVRKR